MFKSLKHHSTLVTLVLLLTTITCVVLFLFFLVERNDYPLRWLLFFWISLLLIYLTGLANIFLRSKNWPSTIIMSLSAPIVIISVIEICTWSSNVSDHFYNAGDNGNDLSSSNIPQYWIDNPFYTELENEISFFSDGIRAYVLKPNVSNDVVTSNSLGFRGGEFIPKPAGEFRIGLLGGSSAYGWQASSDQLTVPSILENLFKEKVSDSIRILNFAVPAGYTKIDYNIVASYCVDLDVDAIVLLGGHNDIAGASERAKMITEFSTEYLRNKDRGSFIFSMFIKSAGYLLERALFHINTAKWIGKSLTKNEMDKELVWAGAKRKRDSNYYKENISNYTSDIERLFKLSNRLGIDVYAFHQPNYFREIMRRKHNGQHVTESEYSHLKGHVNTPYWEHIIASPNKLIYQINKTAKLYGYRYYSLEDTFDQHTGRVRQGEYVDPETLYISNTHWAETGARMIANKIFNIIKKDIENSINITPSPGKNK